MHEVDMTKCLVLSMNEWRQQHEPAVPVVSQVHLQVGDFTCVEPEQLVHTWRIAIQNSWLAGAELTIEQIPLVARCVCCNSTYCSHPMEDIVSGRELRIRSVDYSLITELAPLSA